jgi:uncharacterized damage-inducible protein DinB
MNTEVQSIARSLQTVLNGEPWYGRSVYELLDEIAEDKIMIKPAQKGHSLLELLYHLNTWALFTLKSLEDANTTDIETIESLNWRPLNSDLHTWKRGVQEFKDTHNSILNILKDKTDEFLEDIVSRRTYSKRFLLNGLIQHNIYHIGQITYINKFLV